MSASWEPVEGQFPHTQYRGARGILLLPGVSISQREMKVVLGPRKSGVTPDPAEFPPGPS